MPYAKQIEFKYGRDRPRIPWLASNVVQDFKVSFHYQLVKGNPSF